MYLIHLLFHALQSLTSFFVHVFIVALGIAVLFRNNIANRCVAGNVIRP